MENNMKARESIRLRQINVMVGAAAQRDLELLRNIDTTLEALENIRADANIFTEVILRELVNIKTIKNRIDEDGKLLKMFEVTRDRMEEFHSQLSRKRDAARRDRNLREDDGIEEAYCGALESVADFHRSLNDLCWALGEHDADFDEEMPGGPYTTVEELLAALKA